MKDDDHETSFPPASISHFKKPAIQDTENVGNRHAPETSTPPNLQPANTNRSHHHPAWLKKQLSEGSITGMPVHDEMSAGERGVKERVIQSAHEACRRVGTMPVQKGSNIEWETAPFLIKRERAPHQLRLKSAHIASGYFGSISIFEDENGDKLIGKISNNKMPDGQGGIKDDLAIELDAYKTIYDHKKAGPHRNLVNVYGIAQVPHGDEMKRTLLMDFVPGPSGEETFNALFNCVQADKITPAQYWGAIQFIGRRLLDVTEHLGKAKVVHNDIKPANFIVNEGTIEPVVIDLGVWSKKGEMATGGTRGFHALEVEAGEGVDERSDVFTVAASLLNGVEGIETPNEGMFQHDPFRNEDGNVVRAPTAYAAETDYTRFMNSILKENKDTRVDSKAAKKHPFLNGSMLDDNAAKEVIKKAIELAGEETQKPTKEQWKRVKPQFYESEERNQRAQEAINGFLKNRNLRDYMNLIAACKTNPVLKKYFIDEVAPLGNEIMQKAINEFWNKPNLHDYALLQKASKISPKLRNTWDTDEFIRLRNDLEQEAAYYAEPFLARSPMFDAGKKITETVNIRKSGVKKNGLRENKNIDLAYESSVIQAKKDLKPHADIEDIEDLRNYAEEAEAFLRDAMALKKINNPEIADKIEKVKAYATIARRMAEILDTEPTNHGIVEKRVLEFEDQLKHRK